MGCNCRKNLEYALSQCDCALKALGSPVRMSRRYTPKLADFGGPKNACLLSKGQ
jgi:hypothetical protein